jgi:hypothetical protein
VIQEDVEAALEVLANFIDLNVLEYDE